MADPAALIPRTTGSIDPTRLRALALSPVDGFVLSRVDGETSAGDLAEAMGLEVEDVFGSLLKLEALGLVALSAATPRAERNSQPHPRAQAAPAPVPPPPPPKAPPPAVPPPPATAAFAPEPDVEIDENHQRQIIETFGRLNSLDHYALLGVERTADKKAIKRAYFEATGRFHPDRFFRKRLGSLKLKMETIFARMTEAHDTLTTNARRTDYDAYLGSVEQSRGIEKAMADAAREIKRADEAVRQAPQSSVPPPPSRPVSQPPPSSLRGVAPPAPPSAPRPSVAPKPGSTTSPNLGALLSEALEGKSPSKPAPPGARISIPPARSDPPTTQSRRDAFARRLTGPSIRAPAPARVPAVAYAKPDDAVDALKRRYEEKVSLARGSQARKYAESGLAAKEKGDVVGAANALNVALSFDPENAELKAAHAEAQRAADQILADQYLKQAEYEERSERWADAARSWQRVARAREGDARAHDRGAHCLVKADGNLHEAAALGQRAVQLAPKNAHYRLTLANVYLAAGLALNAKRELDAAAQLAPDDPHVTALLKRIAKSG
ncbi:MAG TPA: DnaJ domain-containing protein [Polyangiaceae bacterium]